MKRFYFQFRVMLITLALGLSSASFFSWTNDYLTEIPVDLPKVHSSSVFEVITKKNGARFESIGHACGGTNIYGGGGSITGYQSDDWQWLSVSSGFHENAKRAKREIDLRVKEAASVLDSTETFNKNLKLKEKRLVLGNERDGRKWVNILKYDGDRFIEITTASSLELVLEFERTFEESKNSRK